MTSITKDDLPICSIKKCTDDAINWLKPQPDQGQSSPFNLRAMLSGTVWRKW